MLRRARCRRMDIGLHPQVRRLHPTSCRDDLPSQRPKHGLSTPERPTPTPRNAETFATAQTIPPDAPVTRAVFPRKSNIPSTSILLSTDRASQRKHRRNAPTCAMPAYGYRPPSAGPPPPPDLLQRRSPKPETQAWPLDPGKTHPHATQRQNLRHSPANPSGRARNQSRLSSQIKHPLDLHPPLDRPCFAKKTPSKCSDVRDAGVWISASIRRSAASARPPAETISQARDPSMASRPRKDPPPRHATPKPSPQPRQSLRMRP